jgi:hypothetical protein
MEAIISSDTSGATQPTTPTRRHIPEDDTRQLIMLFPSVGIHLKFNTWKKNSVFIFRQMEAAGSPKELVPIYQTTWRHVTGDFIPDIHSLEKLKSQCSANTMKTRRNMGNAQIKKNSVALVR